MTALLLMITANNPIFRKESIDIYYQDPSLAACERYHIGMRDTNTGRYVYYKNGQMAWDRPRTSRPFARNCSDHTADRYFRLSDDSTSIGKKLL
jgi:hypothetical protein